MKKECNENAMHSGVLFAALTLKVFGDVIKQVFSGEEQDVSKKHVNRNDTRSLIVGVIDSGTG